jgi:electron transport complex protein RnfB
VARANYHATIDPDECVGCRICAKRCQVHAITEQDGIATVDTKKCVGCGLCATGCPNKAAKLARKPDKEVVDPPIDFAAREHKRLLNREPAE